MVIILLCINYRTNYTPRTMETTNEFLEEYLTVNKDIRKHTEFGHTLGVILLVIEIIAFVICFGMGITGN